ncbi:hypothetical protein HYV73_02225 [Candidatus Uhrbacteria bacterium]|nr:hypothetical protein [Candidatus Uhrbacteria bacterium]
MTHPSFKPFASFLLLALVSGSVCALSLFMAPPAYASPVSRDLSPAAMSASMEPAPAPAPQTAVFCCEKNRMNHQPDATAPERPTVSRLSATAPFAAPRMLRNEPASALALPKETFPFQRHRRQIIAAAIKRE